MDQGTLHPKQGFMGENHGSLGHGVNGYIQFQVQQIIQIVSL